MQIQQAPGHPSARSATAPVVAVVPTTPETVQDDIARAMQLAGAAEFLPPARRTLLKVNISWQHWYPGCSSTPWQIEGVANALKAMGHNDLVAAHNGTVVVDSYEGEENNKHKAAQDRVGLPAIHLDSPPNRWIDYKPRAEMLALDDIFPEGIQIPECFPDTNIVHLPTMKTHVFTTMTGAMKNAFGGLLHRKRHWTHSVIHETLVDLLAIQQEIHPGLFAVMDGTFAGDGPGPRAMRWHIKNRILASADQVAIDAVAARMMGFDPMSIPFHPAGPRARVGLRRGRRHRRARRGHQRRQLAVLRRREYLCQPRPETHLLGSAQAAGEYAVAQSHSRLGLPGLQPVPQRLLAKDQGPPPHRSRPQDRMGPPVQVVLGRTERTRCR